MSATVLGRMDWGMTRDEDGHRNYSIVWKVSAGLSDGPAVLSQASGLPVIGSYWNFGADSDSWAFCYPNLTIRPMVTEEKGLFWTIEQVFSTKPLKRCQTNTIEDPLNEPADIRGGFSKFQREATEDRNGNALLFSSLERIRGAAAEFDESRPNVQIALNRGTNPLSTYVSMMDTVNDATLWGLAARKVKLSNVSWERKLYGTCTYYYRVTYEFDVNDLTWDRTLIDEGTRVLIPGGDPTNPMHFRVAKDEAGENLGKIPLDGAGNALAAGDPPFEFTIEKYAESNFLLLGIPTSL